jgi:hypothetical protein
MVCPVEGMVLPCSFTDLPTPFEPVVNYQGLPTLQYTFPDYSMPPSYDSLSCLRLNPGYTTNTMQPLHQLYFFGELIPPYIDVLGRGPYFRSTEQSDLKYQKQAQCYINKQRYGSVNYQRMADFYGPNYDIQFGENNQGYSDPGGKVPGYFGQGSLAISLPTARRFEPSFNCTRGFLLMNESRTYFDAVGNKRSVFTNAVFDPVGVQRPIFLGEDVFYTGTCETDSVCYTAVSLSNTTQGTGCSEGYVCDQSTSSDRSVNFLCREGYVCDFGTTPDSDINSPMGQFR